MTRGDHTATELACQVETEHEVILADERAEADARDNATRASDHLSEYEPSPTFADAHTSPPLCGPSGEASDGPTVETPPRPVPDAPEGTGRTTLQLWEQTIDDVVIWR